jgi:hypothetical protein
MGLGNVYFWKNDAQEEIDFVWVKQQQIEQLIQVSIDLKDSKVQEREFRALLKGAKSLKCENLLVITESKDSSEIISWGSIKKTVQFIPLWKWLMNWESERTIKN